jgi:ABC-2 type transport system permease protein
MKMGDIMTKLLKSNFYRLFKSRAFYICTIVYTGLMTLSLVLLKLLDNLFDDSSSAEEISFLNLKDGIGLGIANFSDGQVLLFLAIFISIFITAEYTYGTMKNIVSKGFEKYKIYLSYVITLTLAAYIMVAFCFLITTITGSIITGSIASYNGPVLLKTLRLVVIEMLLHSAITSVFVMVAMTIRSNGGVIAINICILMFGSMAYEILNLIVKNLLEIDTKLNFGDYSLQNNIYAAGQTLDNGGEIIRPILVGLFFLVISTALGILAFRKSDVK